MWSCGSVASIAAVAVRTGDGWLLHCGDAYFHHGELEEPRRCPAGLRVFQRVVAIDDDARRRNRARLCALRVAHADMRVFSAHDPVELAQFD